MLDLIEEVHQFHDRADGRIEMKTLLNIGGNFFYRLMGFPSQCLEVLTKLNAVGKSPQPLFAKGGHLFNVIEVIHDDAPGSAEKAVGAFHALSRERADARCYPAVDPLESWSRYPGVIPADRLRQLRRLLTKAHEIGQMMKVVGEEGTPLADFILYLKGEFFDAVYLQQNAFDPVDAATPAARQQCVFALLEDLLAARFALNNRDEAREFFQRLRLHVLELNRAPWESAAFAEQFRRIRDFAAGQCEGEGAMTAAGPLRLALVENPLEAEIYRAPRMKPATKADLAMRPPDETDHP